MISREGHGVGARGSERARKKEGAGFTGARIKTSHVTLGNVDRRALMAR